MFIQVHTFHNPLTSLLAFSACDQSVVKLLYRGSAESSSRLLLFKLSVLKEIKVKESGSGYNTFGRCLIQFQVLCNKTVQHSSGEKNRPLPLSAAGCVHVRHVPSDAL
jgi:hypothetical protein